MSAVHAYARASRRKTFARLPSLRTCVNLLRLRRDLPRMLEDEPLDVLLERLDAWRPSRPRPVSRDRLEASITMAEAVVRLGLARNTCLYRSMGRYALLHAHGVPALFVMGVRPPPHATGHAWVEDDDGPYREEIEDNQYIVTYVHPVQPVA